MASVAPVILSPLCERPAKHIVPLTDLIKWRDSARRKAATLASKKTVDRDGRSSPSLDELTSELNRYLDDAVGSWRQNTDLSAGVRLRNSLQELTQGWDDRIDRRKPMEYIVNCALWRDIRLVIQEGVLIPRVETEQLVDLAGEAVSQDGSLVWADIGTGSGAIAIGVARLLGRHGGQVVAVDIGDVPLAVAKANVIRCQLEDKVKVIKGSWFSPFEGKAEKLAAVLCNPPYVPTKTIRRMRAEACEHEPWSAMNGGENGLDHLMEVCDASSSVLRPGGFIALETDGGDQAYLSRTLNRPLKIFSGRHITVPHQSALYASLRVVSLSLRIREWHLLLSLLYESFLLIYRVSLVLVFLFLERCIAHTSGIRGFVSSLVS